MDILKNAQEVQLKHLEAMRSRLTACEAAFSAVDPGADQDLFIDHNIAPFSPPTDWTFEPCASHYDHVRLSLQGRYSCRTLILIRET